MRVLKPFRTAQRKFHEGQVITSAEITGDYPETFWRDGGFLGDDDARPAPEPMPEPAADEPPAVEAAI